MNSRSSAFWVGLAMALLAFILIFERHWDGSTRKPAEIGKLLPGITPENVTALQVRRGTQFVHLRREGEEWQLTTPVTYPANKVVVDTLLNAIDALNREARIDSAKFADFGLAEPRVNIILQSASASFELQVGTNTPGGSQVYVRVVGQDGVYPVDRAILDHIPEQPAAWRSRSLCSGPTLVRDRFEIRSPARGLGFTVNFTNRQWRLVKPLQARANAAKVEQLLQKLVTSRVVDFVTDDPKADLEQYGLLTPEFETVFGTGTNDLLVLQFGKSPANDPTQVYVRRMSQTNVVLVARELADALRVPFADMRERHLFAFDARLMTQMDVRAVEAFSAIRGTNAWRLTSTNDVELYNADLQLLSETVGQLLQLQVAEFEKDVVIDFNTYGLAKPMRQITISSNLGTNGNGTVTNVILGQVDFGTNGAGKIFAHRWDEDAVYAVKEEDFLSLPDEPWPLRERRIWDFAVSNVVRVTVSEGGRTHQLLRTGDKEWALSAGSQGLLNKAATEQTVAKFGTLAAQAWVSVGADAKPRYGFKPDGHQIAFEVRGPGGVVQTNTVDFGRSSNSGVPYASVMLEGRPWIFDFNLALYQEVLRDLVVPKLP